MSAGCRSRGGERGQSTVELAFALIPFLLVVMGIFDLGRAVFYTHALNDAAREAARVGVNSAHPSDDLCARAFTTGGVPGGTARTTCGSAGDLTVQVIQRGAPGVNGSPVQVRVTYDFKPLTPLVGQLIGAITLSSTSSMFVEC